MKNPQTDMGKMLRRLKHSWLLGFLIPFLLSSCQKDELTKPAGVVFQFKLDRLATPDESLSFQSGTMDINAIAFTGDRDNGEDISFTSDFGAIVHADLGTGHSDPLIEFDIPQGTYRQISLMVNPDETAPDILVVGTYASRPLSNPVPIRLEIDLPGQLTVIAESADGNTDIVLQKDSRSTVDVFLNPSLWFKGLPLLSLDAAEVQNISGVPSIVISKNANPELYAKLTGLIGVSVEAVFK